MQPFYKKFVTFASGFNKEKNDREADWLPVSSAQSLKARLPRKGQASRGLPTQAAETKMHMSV